MLEKMLTQLQFAEYSTRGPTYPWRHGDIPKRSYMWVA